MHVALQCECSVPAAEWLDSTVVGIAHLVSHKAGECILCREGSEALFPNDFGGGLVSFDFKWNKTKIAFNNNNKRIVLHFLLSYRRNQDGLVPSLAYLLNGLGFDGRA